MTIVFISYNSSPAFDKPEQWLLRIEGYIGILESLSNYHKVISIEQINYEGSLRYNNVQYYFLKNEKEASFVPFRLHSLVKKLKPDVVVVHGLNFHLQVLQLRMFLKRQTKIIAQHHAEKPLPGYKYIQRFADKCIDAYWFTSVEMSEEWIASGSIPAKKRIWGIMEASSVFNPSDKPGSKKRTGANEKRIYLFVGRLNKIKDPATVVKAFLQFNQLNANTRLYMIYHTTELLFELQQLVEEAENKEAIVFVGKLPHEEMGYWFNSADFIISGSLYEGSGVAVCEGMSCGCIPLLTDIKPFYKLTGNGKCGFLFKKGNVSSLFAMLMQSMEINIEYEREKVLKQFQDELSFDTIAAQLNEKITTLFKDNHINPQ